MQRSSSIVDILFRYQQRDPLSVGDRRILEHWFQKNKYNQDLFNLLSDKEAWNRELKNFGAMDDRAIWKQIEERVGDVREEPVVRIFPWKKWAAVAAIFAGAVVGTFYLSRHNNGVIQIREQTQEERFKNDVAEATAQATLTLPDGTLIRLDKAPAGLLDGANSIWKTDSNSLVVKAASDQSDERFSNLATAIGTIFHITLSDGSQAWLNAGSNLQFPAVFSGPRRTVILSGEAYFEIAKDKEKPFVVEAGGGETRVIGTHFNVRSYATESTTRTSLLEGLLRFRAGVDSVVLRPGQQASLRQSGKISVDSVNTQAAVAWRENLFWFQSESFEGIMNELAHWYPIQVSEEGKITERFTGILPRSRSLIEVLKILEFTGHVNFRINGNRVEVIPRKAGTENP